MKNKMGLPTYFKYLFTYLLLYAVFIIVSWFIVKKQMAEELLENQVDSLYVKINSLGDKLDEELCFLSMIDSSIKNNKVLFKYCHELDDVDTYDAKAELQKYEISSLMISGIVYKSKNTQKTISTLYLVEWEGDSVEMVVDSYNHEKIIIDTSQFEGRDSGQIIFGQGKTKPYLIYFPKNDEQNKEQFFYLLNLNEINFKLEMMVSSEVSALAMVGEDYVWFKCDKENLLERYLPIDAKDSGYYKIDEASFLCVGDEIFEEYRLVALVNGEVLEQKIAVVLRNFYLKFIPLVLVIPILIYVSMKVTYSPLSRLTNRLTGGGKIRDRHLNQLENTFKDMAAKNEELDLKLKNYKEMIQKSLLEKLMDAESSVTMGVSDLNKIFDDSRKKRLFIMCLCDQNGNLPIEEVQASLQIDCFPLKREEDKRFFLVNYVGENSDESVRIKSILQSFCDKYGCMAAISKSSESPVDIPMLYANVVSASELWPKMSVVDGAMLPSRIEFEVYPDDKINELSQSLTVWDYRRAADLVNEILQLADKDRIIDYQYQNYYVQNLLMGVLWAIVSVMNESNIDFDDYRDIYYEILYSFRTGDYKENRKLVKDDLKELLKIYESVSSQRQEKMMLIKRVLEEEYCHPEFSIAVLAEKFQVSVSYMSYWFKKDMNVTFSEYLWKMRFENAKKLLLQTDKTVDEVAVMVGYYSRTSFIKKFKQETSMTPTEFRKNNR